MKMSFKKQYWNIIKSRKQKKMQLKSKRTSMKE